MHILLVDDHAALRLGVARLLERIEPNAVLSEASSGREALAILERRPDMDFVLLDLDLPDHNGFELMALIRGKVPRAAVVILSAYDQPGLVREALRLGAMSYLPKNYPSEKFERTLTQVLSGRPHVPAPLTRTDEEIDGYESVFFPAQLLVGPGADALQGRKALTEREKQVARLLIQGWSNKDIGDALDMKEGTTKTHINAIYRKLGVTNRTGLIITVERLGLVL